ncbi:helix-turn-helix transcriptional regulator [Streptomyces sp. NPDC047028]|uniref:helix-turn-helix domain-containing protein n=1 Tax=Streptomyces sp. NPDC047028 TaxID=3155793 RepID=UPI0033C352BA
MVLRREATARQLRLGVELRRLREAAGLTAVEAAALLGANRVQISQIEAGLVGVSEQRVRRLASHYACTDREFVEALVVMATDKTRGWWEDFRGLLPTSFLDLAELEHHATSLREIAILYVPGLLQTEEYARAVFSARIPELAPEELDLRVQLRMRRQRVDVSYDLVIHESALRIRVSDRAASRAQLAELLRRSEARNVSVRVIPFDLDRFGGAASAMTYVRSTVPKLDTVVRDVPHGSAFIDSDAQLGVFRTRFRKVETVALTPGQSRDFIHRLAKDL